MIITNFKIFKYFVKNNFNFAKLLLNNFDMVNFKQKFLKIS